MCKFFSDVITIRTGQILSIVVILHAINYQSIDLVLVITLIFGSIIGVQIGLKIGEFLESSELKTLLAVLLLLSLIHI